ncbi:MAG: M61 family metallopeptidase [Gemmatimonadaceae bacterium]
MPRRAAPLVVTLLTAAAAGAACATRPAPPAAGAPAAAAESPATRGEEGGRRSALDLAYRLAMPDPASHIYEVQLDVGGAVGDTLRLQLPVWSPGRYARMDFARNVQDFRAETGDGARALRWEKGSGSLWRVYPAGASRVRVRYRVFANDLSGTFSVLDTAHANWNGASLFMYVVGHKADPVRLAVDAPPGWMLMSGDATTPQQRDFTFESYDRLIDTPTEVAPSFMVDSFRVDDRLYRVVVHHNGPAPAGARERFVGDVRRIVTYENRVVAPPPLRTYTFLFNIGYPGGDGMEHLFSTQIVNSRPWTDTAQLLPGVTTASHEYFHTWNVKRIRPIALGPFDYTTEQHQPSLWVAEGWTQYYGDVGLGRAGVVPREAMYRTMAARIQLVSESPGRKERSARQASFDAPFFDGAAQPMKTNAANTFLTYYFKGEALAMLLDLEIRARTNNARSLDDALRRLKQLSWDQPNASYYLQGRGYTEADVERAVSDVAGADFHPWFERYVGGVEELPWTETLARAGLVLTVTRDGDGAAHYALGEAPNATEGERRVREGWATGTTSR